MRKLLAGAAATAAAAALAFVPAPAEARASVIPCSDLFGPTVSGTIVFSAQGSPNLFRCVGGPFTEPPNPDDDIFITACDEFFGPGTHGVFLFNKGGASVFACVGGIFGPP
jgi:hypothetical protein